MIGIDIPAELAVGIRAWIADIVRIELRSQLAGIVPPPKPPRPYMTTAEAGEYARVSSHTIRRWISDGRLQAHGAGREIRVRLDDLVEALRPKSRRRNGQRAERELSVDEQVERMLARMDGEREMVRLTNMTGAEALRLAGPVEPSSFAGREGARVRDRNKDQRLVNEGKISRPEFTKRQAERERLSRLDRARLQR
jgi:excisionase family DNA binding protein